MKLVTLIHHLRAFEREYGDVEVRIPTQVGAENYGDTSAPIEGVAIIEHSGDAHAIICDVFTLDSLV